MLDLRELMFSLINILKIVHKKEHKKYIVLVQHQEECQLINDFFLSRVIPNNRITILNFLITKLQYILFHIIFHINRFFFQHMNGTGLVVVFRCILQNLTVKFVHMNGHWKTYDFYS